MSTTLENIEPDIGLEKYEDYDAMKIKISISGICEYLACVVLILECSSIYLNQTQWSLPSSNIILVLGMLPLFFQAVLYIISSSKRGLKALKQLVIYCIFCVLYIITLGKQEFANFAMKLLAIFPMIYISMIYLCLSGKISHFTKRFVNLCCIIAAVSLLLWITGPILGVIGSTGTLRYVWGSLERTAVSYYNIQFVTQIEGTFIGLARNTAFFTEAPKYCLMLLLALSFDWVFFKSKKKEILLFVTMITTFSFTGVLAFIILLFVEYALRTFREIASRKATYKAIVLPAFVVIGLFVSITLLSAKLDTSSGVGRVGDFIVCFEVGMQRPLFGWGFLDNEHLNTVLHASRLASGVGNTMGLSNSICQIFVDGGLYLTLFYLFSLLSYITYGKRKNYDAFVALGCCLVFLFVTTYFAYTGIMFFLLSFGLCLHHFRSIGIKDVYDYELIRGDGVKGHEKRKVFKI